MLSSPWGARRRWLARRAAAILMVTIALMSCGQSQPLTVPTEAAAPTGVMGGAGTPTHEATPPPTRAAARPATPAPASPPATSASPPAARIGAPVAATSRQGDLVIRLQLAKATFLAGEGGEAVASVRNAGTAPVSISGGCYSWAGVALLDEQGHQPPPWPWGQRFGLSCPGTSVAIAPGQEASTTVHFQVPPPDQAAHHRYTLQASVRAGGGSTWRDLRGAPLALAVTPPTPAQYLRATLVADRTGWRLTVTDQRGQAPPGPKWGVFEAWTPPGGYLTFQLLRDTPDGRWAGNWGGPVSSQMPITVRAWLAVPGYVTAAVTQTIPPAATPAASPLTSSDPCGAVMLAP